jgi:hypothetical protein
MIGGEGFVAPNNNGCGSPRSKPATPGGTNGQGTIDAVIEKHNYLLLRCKGDSKQLAGGSGQLCNLLNCKIIISLNYDIVFDPDYLE